MARIVVLYKTPKDAAAFDSYYREKHLPIAKKIPGLKRYQVSDGPVNSPSGPTGIHLIAFLDFENVDAVQKAFASPEGQAAAGDIGNFATGGADLLICETRDV